jgi:hypothetical protein
VRHRGAILVAALVALAILSAIFAQMLHNALLTHRQLRLERDLRQTELLLAAGADRAAYRLAVDPNWRGETWRPMLDATTGAAAPQVTTQAARDAADKPWRVRIVAECPLGSQRSIQRSRSLQIPPSTTPKLGITP